MKKDYHVRIDASVELEYLVTEENKERAIEAAKEKMYAGVIPDDIVFLKQEGKPKIVE